jgi:succinyl-CoA synthetase beta subunit
MKKIKNIINMALENKQRTLSEYESKQIISAYGIPVVKEALVCDRYEARKAIEQIGYPVVLKICSPEVTHKTEKGFIVKDIRNEKELDQAFLLLQERIERKHREFVIQEMIRGLRELAIGMSRDQQFGPCVMFGLGGIFTEIINDVTFRVAPIEKRDALEMMHDIGANRILEEIRGMKAVNLDILSESLIALGKIGMEHPSIQAIDVNPMIIHDEQAVAVDALVILSGTEAR